MDEWTPPPVGPPDKEGFRTFSFYSEAGAEIIRVCVNFDRQRDWLASTWDQEGRYNQQERNRLKLMARIVAARDAFPSGDEEEALAIFLQVSPEWIAKSLETYFPSFALLGLVAASDVCVKRALNRAVHQTGAPRIYDYKMVRKILIQFEKAASEFLQIRPGRPLETEKHLKRTRQALKRLEKRAQIERGKKRPTQDVVSEELGISPRELREWCKACKLKWPEFLRACGWPVKRKEIKSE